MLKHLNENFKLPIDIKYQVDNIAFDNLSGSVLLTKKTIDIFKLLIEKYFKNDNFKNLFENTARSIVYSQPEMASIFTLVNNALFCFDKYFDQKDLNNYLIDYFKFELIKINQSSKMICKYINDLIPKESNIFVYSNSSTVYDFLLYSK